MFRFTGFYRRSALIALLTAFSLIFSLALLDGTLFAGSAGDTTAAEAEETVAVQILSINDFHGALVQSAKISGRPAGGAAYLAAYMWEREATNPRTIMVHAGDAVGASPVVSSLLQDEPTIQFLQFLGTDVGVPGNHEFDEGITELLRLQRGGRHETTGYFPGSGFPLVAANVVDRATGDPVLPPYVIKTVDGIPIGFIGVVTIETPTIVMPSGVAGLAFLDPVETINKYVAELRAQGVEAIVVLAHEGGNQDPNTGEISGPIKDIAEKIDDAVDIIISGHTHTRLDGVVDGKLVVQAASGGTAFADVDFTIDRKTGDVVAAEAEIVDVWADAIQPAPRIAKLVDTYQEKVRPLVQRVVGRAAHDITRQMSPAGESALGNLIADSQRWAAGTQMAFMNPGGIRADLPAGDVTWGKLYEIQPFGNTLVKMTLTGDQIYRLLNQQWQEQPGGQIRTRFLQISGLKYAWDDRRPFGDKVTAVWLESGEPLDRSASYTVVVNSFLAAGGDNFTVFKEAKNTEILQGDLEALVAYVKSLPQPFSSQITGRAIRVDLAQ
ncbi:MAG TPA: bifunctional metallophosphatase/5'-nucleotidase [Firmicutes bacterium]|nr:bifunctional metallophosphatase/5'-nucleotidase [Bacillota bacterium]